MRREGLDDLLAALGEAVATKTVVLSLSIPYENGDVAVKARRLGDVIEEKYDDNGTVLDVRLPATLADQFTAFSR